MSETCRRFQALATGALDETLTREERVALDGHLRECAACADDIENQRAARSWLLGARDTRAPAALRDRVLTAATPHPRTNWIQLAAGLVVGVSLFGLAVKGLRANAAGAQPNRAVEHAVRVVGKDPRPFEQRLELELLRILHSRKK